ncbi:MAG TPA: hypothetical protein VKM55_02330 [Candidatus Lokiarchaeia archaeon]|nr:hypothetical protein [Candidatus Lokiarchaeia archaeon]
MDGENYGHPKIRLVVILPECVGIIGLIIVGIKHPSPKTIVKISPPSSSVKTGSFGRATLG